MANCERSDMSIKMSACHVEMLAFSSTNMEDIYKEELLPSMTLNCQVKNIVMNPGSQS